jgi:hypothetical protein
VLPSLAEEAVPVLLPSQKRAHLAVAAIRIAQHRGGRPPRADEIAALVGWGDAETLVVLRQLVDFGVLLMHETPFEARFEVEDHRKIEALPEAEKEGELQEEVDSFHRKSKSRQKVLDEMFSTGELEKRKKKEMEELEKQFSEFKKKKTRPPL